MLIDTHTHYNFEGLKEQWRPLWQKAQAQGVTHAIQIGTNLRTSQEVVNLAQEEAGFFAAVGFHPQDIDDLNLDKLHQLAQSQKVVALGEIGLDYFRLDREDPASAVVVTRQRQGLIAQIQLAHELNLPLSLHVRDHREDAYREVLEILTATPPQNNFVLHCVSGPKFYLEAMIKKGAWFGFDGNVTYKNAESIREILRLVPTDKVVVETDAPFLPPLPYRGKVCEPWMLTLTADFIAENFGISWAQLATNSQQLYPLFVPYLPESELDHRAE